MMHALIAAAAIATSGAVTPAPSPSVSPAPSPSPSAAASPASAKPHTLALAIPPGWQRTESGQYNEWRSPDGMSNFRVSVMPPSAEFRGPNAVGAVQAAFQKIVGRFNTKAQIAVKTIQVCNGEEAAYRVDDPLGLGSAGFMIVIPGTVSSGLINYEVMPGGKVDPAILTTIDKICWP